MSARNEELKSKTRYKSLKQVYRDALFVQDACNGAGVIQAFYEVRCFLLTLPEWEEKGTNWLNTHPAVVLFVSKLSSLSRAESMVVFSEAHEAATLYIAQHPDEYPEDEP